MHFYKFHLGDYLAHAGRLGRLEDLCYRRLLDLYYLEEKPIDLDLEKVAMKIGYADEMRTVSEIISAFFLKSENGYRNKRCDEEISAYQTRSKSAKRANSARWNANRICNASEIRSGMDADQILTTNHKPLTSNKEKINKKKNSGKRFVKPTIDEIASYCSERKNGVDPQAFMNHYESNGWKVGKNPMKDWKAAIRTWERNGNAKRHWRDRINDEDPDIPRFE